MKKEDNNLGYYILLVILAITFIGTIYFAHQSSIAEQRYDRLSKDYNHLNSTITVLAGEIDAKNSKIDQLKEEIKKSK